VRLLRAAALAVFTAVLAPQPALADTTATLDPNQRWGVWEGWGTSLCWWANVFGTSDTFADLVFTTNYTTYNGTSMPGLGMNIARYNAGACSMNAIGTNTIQLSPNIPAFKQMQGYWTNSSSTDPASTSWNWNADAKQRAMLLKAKARGANKLQLFSNSPMWWMTGNFNPSGADDGGNNLHSPNYQNHAIYLATIAKYAQTNWGITFDSVAPFNEPNATWWNSTGTQEGCRITKSPQMGVIGYLRSELDSRGLTDMAIAASDENSFSQATTTWNDLDSTTKSTIGLVTVHGYEPAGPRASLYNAVAGKRLWLDEHGDGVADGISMTSGLIKDIRDLHTTAWVYWQALDSGGWGLIQSNPGDNWYGGVNPKYYVLAQYMRHIRPGMNIINSTDANTVAAYDPAGRKLVIISMNYGTAQTISYNLTNFYKATGPVSCWTTSPGADLSGSSALYQQSGGIVISNQTFSVSFPTNTIKTFEIQNAENATVTLANLTQTYTGSAISATATTVPGGLTVNLTYNGSPNAPTNAGSYTVVGTINDPNYGGSATGTLVINPAVAIATWINPAGGLWSTAANWSNNIVGGGANITADFSKLDLTSDAVVTLDTPVVIGNLIFADTAPATAGNWILTNSVAGNTLTLQGTNPMVTVNGSSVVAATLYAVVAGTNGLTKTGPGGLFFRETSANTYSGGTIVNQGQVFAYAPTSLGSGNITVNSGTIWGKGVNTIAGASPTNVITINSGGKIDNNWGYHCALNKVVLNGGTLNVSGTADTNYGSWVFNNTIDATNGYATSQITGGNAAVVLTGGTVFNLGASDTLTVSVAFQHLSGSADNGLIKSGAGTLILSTNNTYTGATTVSNGTLLVNGAIGSSAVTVKTGGTLGGTGSIGGAVTVQGGGTLSPGASIGTLTISNRLTLAGTTFVEVNSTNGQSDLVQGVTNLTYGGSLVVSNVAGIQPTNGQTFQLFTVPATFAGNFSSITPALTGGNAWSFNPTNGVLSVASSTASYATNISFSVTGGTLALTWPATHLGWWAQSNSLGLASPSNWFDIPGSSSLTNLNIIPSSSRTNVFYRLRSP